MNDSDNSDEEDEDEDEDEEEEQEIAPSPNRLRNITLPNRQQTSTGRINLKTKLGTTTPMG
eukprot:gnl/Chilomastix_caulleri/8516.p2 GENE.gnl/Chilomastix_caulleri/8516~~gnl/Chilomastix_caulleri/8516.p2  ORF type:complete len:61 (+),score=26.59 gnl/Chilomastix_caulleri/8516:127-309(+)